MDRQHSGNARLERRLGASPLPARVRAWLAASSALVLAERLGQALAPLALVGLLYASLAVFRVFDFAPVWLHWSALGGLAIAAIAAVAWGFRRFVWPTRATIVHRLEADSGLAHRPISHLEDRQASNLVDPLAARLWDLHRRRLRESIGALRLRRAPSTLAARDPFALRFLLVMVAATGFGLFWGDGWERLQAGLQPAGQSKQATAVAVEAWITPPDYTRLAPIALKPGNAADKAEGVQTISVPTGSQLLIQVQDASEPATLLANGERLSFAQVDRLTQRIETTLRSGDAVEVKAGGAHALWPIAIIPDLAPSAKLDEPKANERGVLRLSFTAQDDFGVVATKLTVTRKGESFDRPLLAHAIDPRQVKGASFQDLTAHPWAGLEVELRVSASDALNQIGASAPVAITLPERKFFHPIARAIIEQRKRLAQDPGQVASIIRALRRLRNQTDAYDGNIPTYMALDFAAWRLDQVVEGQTTGKDGAGVIADVQQLLWDTALGLEDGGISLAMRELRRLQQALAEALANGASDEEIQRLMNELQQAMNDYLQQLQQQLARAAEKGMQMGALDENMITLSQRDLNDMLNQARRMAESGARENAQQMLEQLQNMLENLQMGVPMMAGRDSQAQRMMSDLGRIMRQQQQLLEDTFRMQRDRQSGEGEGELGQGPTPGSPGANGDGAMRQEALREMLGDLMRRFSNMTGEIPQGMGSAEQAMRGASEALRGDELEEAARDQNDALQNLQQSLQQMNEMMRQQIGSRGGRGEREPMDPFGRGLSDQEGPGGDAVARENLNRVPLDQQVDRSRQLFEELRARRNQPSRPKTERDYIDRLLRQF